ncbi:MAG TPA: SLC13 family permease [Segeticoccus sp.]|uniref:GntP family permease n=1 Tax=Segeticoccus sp. TaxID=2706531 RepID=UPI002D80EFA8|nr:SLC13 family permease [Segeticoccus sp.]HET8599153.1 SLC13 family permease [Segeticoccus sp.]
MTAYHLALFATAAGDKPLSHAGHAQLILAALAGIATVVVLIVWAKFHPFIGLILGTAVLGAVAAVPPEDVVTSFIDGLGSTFGSVGLLIALGAMLGKLLADSGGANVIVDTIISKVGRRTLPWAMALIAGIIGLPMFFEIGVVILVPIVILVARRTGVSLMKVGIPALAGLSILHGLVPPHPGPLTAISLLHADLGYTLVFGLIIAVPTLVISGPFLAQFMDRAVPVTVGADLNANAGVAADSHRDAGTSRTADIAPDEPGGAKQDQTSPVGTATMVDESVTKRPSFGLAVISVVLPVLMMLVRAVGEFTVKDGTTLRSILDFIGEPSVALLAGVLLAMLALGRAAGMPRAKIHESLGSGLPGVASIMLIVAAGGGFKTLLSDSGVANVIADYAEHAHMSVLLLGWLVAVGIRLATGSATVATITAAGIVGPLGQTLDQPHLALLVLAVGAGSLFFSHVNDAGFWLVKEYFGLTVGQTIKSWSVMETVISVVALICVLILGAVV